MRNCQRFIAILVILSVACTVQLVPIQREVLEVPTQGISKKPHPAPTPPVFRQAAYVTAERSVNVREKATEHSRDVGDLWRGEVVIVVGCFSDWAKIGTNQYVKSDYLGGICDGIR
jgi:uncharacterized protein YgiM (DUF1202 family)